MGVTKAQTVRVPLDCPGFVVVAMVFTYRNYCAQVVAFAMRIKVLFSCSALTGQPDGEWV